MSLDHSTHAQRKRAVEPPTDTTRSHVGTTHGSHAEPAFNRRTSTPDNRARPCRSSGSATDRPGNGVIGRRRCAFDAPRFGGIGILVRYESIAVARQKRLEFIRRRGGT
jgi:hypothetical protein